MPVKPYDPSRAWRTMLNQAKADLRALDKGTLRQQLVDRIAKLERKIADAE